VWNGSGVNGYAGANPSLDDEVCGTDNGAPVDGSYLQWVLVAKEPTSATLTVGTDAPVAMTRNGKKGTFKYVQTGEAQCLTTTYTGSAVVQFYPATLSNPTKCQAVQLAPPTTTDTIVMQVNPTFFVPFPPVTSTWP